MFKLLKLHIYDHPFLGDLNLDLVDDGEEKNGPYTTVIIGKNGTGKSLILRIVADLMEDIRSHYLDNDNISAKRRAFKTNFVCEGVLLSDIGKIDFAYHPETAEEPGKRGKKRYHFYFTSSKNRSVTFKSVAPSNVSANAYLVNDKFRFTKNEISDFYIYLGLRNTANSAGTKSYLNRIIPLIADYIRNDSNLTAIRTTLKFLEFDSNHFEIAYVPRYKGTFFQGNITKEALLNNLKNWKKFSKRESAPRYYSFFESNVLKDEKLAQSLAHFLNKLTRLSKVIEGKGSKIRINALTTSLRDIKLLQVLSKLDLVSSPEVIVSKNNQQLELQNTSSGEFHFFMSVLGLLSNIRDSSLILIDEPEISFHPNWQLKYLYYLREIFKKFKSCHFIIATHSHFMISDLDPKTSSIIRVVRNEEGKLEAESIKEETYGLSAEEILYRVFELRSYRNYYFEIELRELLHLISINSGEESRIRKLVQNLRKVELDKNDPLTLILTQADEYLKGL